MRRVALAICMAAVAAGVAAVPAHAARHASPTSVASSPCTQAAPCSLTGAIAAAAANEEVVLAPGDYPVAATIDPGKPLIIRGTAGQARPRLVGDAKMTLATVSMKDGGLLRHLSIEASGTGADALTLQNGDAEGLVISSLSGDGAKLNGAAGVTVLRDSVVRTTATASSNAALKLRDGQGIAGGDIALVNVTAVATAGQANGLRCETSTGLSQIVNTIVRGASYDISAAGTGVRCTATSSNFRTLMSTGTLGTVGNTSADPRFTNLAGGNLRALAGAPGIDTGTVHAGLGTIDLDGRARTIGLLPDMGAFEFDAGVPPGVIPPVDFPPLPPVAAPGTRTPSPTPSPSPSEPAAGDEPRSETTTTPPAETPADPAPVSPAFEAAPLAPPMLGRSVALQPARGTVLVRLPGSALPVALAAGATVPVGSVVDATRGAVTLSSALDAAGATQDGTFSGGAFEVRQDRSARGMVDIVLTGGDFSACRPARRGAGRASAAGRRRKAVRRLWGSDRSGRFRTRGRNSVATVRGTRWLTEDRCEGTLTRVVEGAVEVRDTRRGTTRLVRAGGQVLVRAKKR